MTARLAPGQQSGYSIVTAGALAVTVAYVVGTMWALANLSYDLSGALLIGPVLGVAAWLIFRASANRTGDEWLGRLVPWILTAKFFGTIARYAVIFIVYGGESDARDYDETAKILAPGLRHLQVTMDIGKIPGMGFMRLLSGMVYAVIGPSRFAGFLVFSWMGLIGVFLFYRAFCIALPHADVKRYSLLLFFLPSMLFWPSSIGKESWMLLTLGLTAYGGAKLLRGKPAGLIWVGVGVTAMSFMRPHVSLAVFLGLTAAYIVRRPENPSPLGPLTKLLGIVFLVIGALLIVSRVEGFFNVDALDREGIQAVLEQTGTRNVGDASSFTPVVVNNPLELPAAAVTVLFRPFPTEAGNAQGLGSALEGLLLMGLILYSLPQMFAAVRNSTRAPYNALAFVFVLLFIVAFSSLGNFGLLARQRVQVIPFLLVLLAWKPLPVEAVDRRWPGGRRQVPFPAKPAAPPLAGAGKPRRDR